MRLRIISINRGNPPETLNLGLRIPQVARHSFDQIHQADDQLSGILVLDVVQVNVFQHNAAILFASDQTASLLLLCFRGFPPVY